jgi:hypothetical protein
MDGGETWWSAERSSRYRRLPTSRSSRRSRPCCRVGRVERVRRVGRDWCPCRRLSPFHLPPHPQIAAPRRRAGQEGEGMDGGSGCTVAGCLTPSELRHIQSPHLHPHPQIEHDVDERDAVGDGSSVSCVSSVRGFAGEGGGRTGTQPVSIAEFCQLCQFCQRRLAVGPGCPCRRTALDRSMAALSHETDPVTPVPLASPVPQRRLCHIPDRRHLRCSWHEQCPARLRPP